VQNSASACSPETIGRLQEIFDAVWLALGQQKSPHTFPWAIEATRFTVARLVLEHVNDLQHPERIIREVLEAFTNPGELAGVPSSRTLRA
jgi:hypothetical protein